MTDAEHPDPQRADDSRSATPTLGDVVAEIAGDAGDARLDLASALPLRSVTAGDQWVLLSQSGSNFAVPIGGIQDVGSVPVFTWVPGTPSWVLGVTNFRGEIISVVDLGAFLGLPPSSSRAPRRMVVAQTRQHSLMSGFVVDTVAGEVRIDATKIRPPTAPIDDRIQPYLAGVSRVKGEIHALLDLERLMLSDAFRVTRSPLRVAHAE